MSSTRKPLRLRSACTECYAAKVRCSGQKEGCDRCRRNGLVCEYQVSMVGRASKKRRTAVQPSETSYQSESECISISLLENSLPPMDSTVDDFPNVTDETELDDYLQNLLNDYPDLPLLSSGATKPFSQAPENLPSNTHADTNGTSSFENVSTPSGPQQAVLPNTQIPSALDQTQTPDLVRSRLADQTQERVPSVYRDRLIVSQYPHAAALMRTIEDLEEQLQTSQVPVDQAMLLNRQAMSKVREVSTTDEFRRCQSCPLLVTTIMDLVLGLYELVIVSIQQPTDQEDDGSLADQNARQPVEASQMPGSVSTLGPANTRGSAVPVFHFGCLEFDPDEQEIFQTAMIRRDLRRCVETIQYCSQEILPRQRQAANISGGVSQQARSSSAFVHTQAYQEMGYRAKELLAALPAKCSH